MAVNTRIPSIYDLWELFWKYEDNVRNSTNTESGHMNATMANAIARLIAVREGK